MFKEGDKIRMKKTCSGALQGKEYILFLDPSIGALSVRLPNGETGCTCQDKWELINNKTMNIKEQFALALTPEPQKSFRKVGITNGDNLLTDDGMRIFLTWLLGKEQEEFKKMVVDDMVKELEKDK